MLADIISVSMVLLAVGYSFTTTFHRPTIWTEPFPPSVVLEPTLPDEDGHVGSRQVEIESTEVGRSHGHLDTSKTPWL